MQSMNTLLFCLIALASCGGGGETNTFDPPTTVIASSAPPPGSSPDPSASASPTARPTPSSPAPATASPSPQTSTGFIWGANGHPFTAYPGVSWEQQLDLLKQAGLTQYRVNLGGGSPLDNLDKLIALAEARGIQILPILFHEGSLQNDSAETIYARSRTVAEQVGRRFAGRIKVWELENELEGYAIIQPCEMRDDGTKYPCEWGPAGGVSPLEYYGPRWRKVSAALKGLSDGLRAGDPNAKRAIGTAGWGHAGAFDRMKQDGIGWEISVWHAYEINEDMLVRVAAHAKPIWITEFNSKNPDVDDATRAGDVQRMLDRLKAIRSTYNIQQVSFYELLDEPYWTDYEGRQGMIRLVKQADGSWRLGTTKPVFDVIKRTAAGG